MEYNLFHDYETFAATDRLSETTFTYKPEELVDPDADPPEWRWTGAELQFAYGAYLMTQEPICFTGDFFPFYAPSCQLLNSAVEVPTRIHDPREYAIDMNILELKLNEDWEWQVPAEPVVYARGAIVEVSRDLSDTLAGYVDLDTLTAAVPDSITIMALPACGVLTKSGVLEGEQTFAMFWSYSVQTGFTTELHIGDHIDLQTESVSYEFSTA